MMCYYLNVQFQGQRVKYNGCIDISDKRGSDSVAVALPSVEICVCSVTLVTVTLSVIFQEVTSLQM